MPLDDSDPEKWVMKEHTNVKHEILGKYVTSWTRVLQSGHPKIFYFDGFAGRGRYEDGEKGSPILAMEIADAHSQFLDDFICTFVEKDEDNYGDLSEEIEQVKEEIDSDTVHAQCENAAFADVAGELIDDFQEDGRLIAPGFFFIDPFGFKGVPFQLVSDIINLRAEGVEVFLTFMVRDIRRFMENEDHEASITEILGTEEWKEIIDDESIESKGDELLKLYENRLKTVANAKYVWPFEMKMPERRETVYYLIHATNHFKGFKIMKDVMYSTGAEDRFAYLGPDHYAYDDEQQTLFDSTDSTDSRVSDLASYLYDKFEGETLDFWNIMKETYTDTDLIEKHYRRAVKELRDQGKATIHNYPNRKDGSERGLQPDDEVEFDDSFTSLTDF